MNVSVVQAYLGYSLLSQPDGDVLFFSNTVNNNKNELLLSSRYDLIYTSEKEAVDYYSQNMNLNFNSQLGWTVKLKRYLENIKIKSKIEDVTLTRREHFYSVDFLNTYRNFSLKLSPLILTEFDSSPVLLNYGFAIKPFKTVLLGFDTENRKDEFSLVSKKHSIYFPATIKSKKNNYFISLRKQLFKVMYRYSPEREDMFLLNKYTSEVEYNADKKNHYIKVSYQSNQKMDIDFWYKYNDVSGVIRGFSEGNKVGFILGGANEAEYGLNYPFKLFNKQAFFITSYNKYDINFRARSTLYSTNKLSKLIFPNKLYEVDTVINIWSYALKIKQIWGVNTCVQYSMIRPKGTLKHFNTIIFKRLFHTDNLSSEKLDYLNIKLSKKWSFDSWSIDTSASQLIPIQRKTTSTDSQNESNTKKDTATTSEGKVYGGLVVQSSVSWHF